MNYYGKKDEERAISLFQGMIERNIKKWWVTQGSMNVADNEEVFSRIHKYGIGIFATFMYGTDFDTPETMQRHTNYIINSGVDAIIPTSVTPLSGTSVGTI